MLTRYTSYTVTVRIRIREGRPTSLQRSRGARRKGRRRERENEGIPGSDLRRIVVAMVYRQSRSRI